MSWISEILCRKCSVDLDISNTFDIDTALLHNEILNILSKYTKELISPINIEETFLSVSGLISDLIIAYNNLIYIGNNNVPFNTGMLFLSLLQHLGYWYSGNEIIK